MEDTISDYEKKRLANIAEKEAFLASILPKINAVKAELPDDIHVVGKQPRPKRKVRRRSKIAKDPNYVPRRSSRIEELKLKTKRVKAFRGFREVRSDIVDPQTGQRITDVKYVCDDDDTGDDDWDKYEKVEFYLSTTDDDDDDNEDDDDESDNENGEVDDTVRKRRASYRQSSVPEVRPEDVTDEMIQNVAQNSSYKVYDSVKGTCCHQCRQKTLDTKSVCRSNLCSGVRGQFCGPCLLNRYGEDVAVVLKDPNWQCPPCRGVCNCSICRTRQGKAPTGILVPYVKEKGYLSVNEFLQENECKEEGTSSKFSKTLKIKIVAIKDNTSAA